MLQLCTQILQSDLPFRDVVLTPFGSTKKAAQLYFDALAADLEPNLNQYHFLCVFKRHIDSKGYIWSKWEYDLVDDSQGPIETAILIQCKDAVTLERKISFIQQTLSLISQTIDTFHSSDIPKVNSTVLDCESNQ